MSQEPAVQVALDFELQNKPSASQQTGTESSPESISPSKSEDLKTNETVDTINIRADESVNNASDAIPCPDGTNAVETNMESKENDKADEMTAAEAQKEADALKAPSDAPIFVKAGNDTDSACDIQSTNDVASEAGPVIAKEIQEASDEDDEAANETTSENNESNEKSVNDGCSTSDGANANDDTEIDEDNEFKILKELYNFEMELDLRDKTRRLKEQEVIGPRDKCLIRSAITTTFAFKSEIDFFAFPISATRASRIYCKAKGRRNVRRVEWNLRYMFELACDLGYLVKSGRKYYKSIDLLNDLIADKDEDAIAFEKSGLKLYKF